jgi:ammonia channel protein AmtB
LDGWRATRRLHCGRFATGIHPRAEAMHVFGAAVASSPSRVKRGLRVDAESEKVGLDVAQHGEMLAPNA